MKLSILCPTRKRPQFMLDLWQSVKDTADNLSDIELIFYIDKDDQSSIDMFNSFDTNQVKSVIDERGDGNLSEMWNACYEISNADIVMHCGDDIRFRTPGWDAMVINEFDNSTDKIILVYGDDGVRKDDLATHGFLHKNWIETVGYFLPPYFSSDMNDYWLTTIARNLGRLKKIDIYTEHLHPAVGKHHMDETHSERVERGNRDNVRELYKNKQGERDNDTRKLHNFIKTYDEKNIN